MPKQIENIEQEDTLDDYCPVCGAVWTISEIEDQTCDACGYPEGNEFDDD